MGENEGFLSVGGRKEGFFIRGGENKVFFYQENKGLFTIKWRQDISFYFLKHGFSV